MTRRESQTLGLLVNNEWWENIEKFVAAEVLSQHTWERMKLTMKNSNQKCKFPERDSIQGPPKNEAELIATRYHNPVLIYVRLIFHVLQE
jgi:hypothetical protein